MDCSISRHWNAVAVVLFLLWYSLLTKAQNATKDSITHPNEVKSLKDVKSSLVDVNNTLSSWNNGDPCTANWIGVLCFNSAQSDGYLHVRELQLIGLDLSGDLSPSIGNLSRLEILDFMWNKIGGSIPKEIGKIKSLKLLLLNGNRFVGSLPDELGFLPVLDRIQVDQNNISGPLPVSFANLNKTRHFHMNNNSISGQIPSELSRLPSLVHFLLDNNNLTGFIPPEFSQLPNIRIIQLDNNNFEGSTIPKSFSNIPSLLKLSLRNCRLRGPIPDLSGSSELLYLDLSMNNLNGPISEIQLSSDITTIDLSYNNLNGTIPDHFSQLPRIQKLSLANNSFAGSISSSIWQKRALDSSEQLNFNFENNSFSSILGTISVPKNVTVSLKGNPGCINATLAQLCRVSDTKVFKQSFTNSDNLSCIAKCPQSFEYSPNSPIPCFCAAPLIITYRLKSPGFYDFIPYKPMLENFLTESLLLNLYQLDLYSFVWEAGPRLKMDLKFFPVYDETGENPNVFNDTEARRILEVFTEWKLPDNQIFGPVELLDITLLPPYETLSRLLTTSSGLRAGQVIGIVLGGVAAAVVISSIVCVYIIKTQRRTTSTLHRKSKAFAKLFGVRDFKYNAMAAATNNFDSRVMIGQGGYGKVYKGVLSDGTVVAIKRAQKESLQGEAEFLTEIELLSRLHHRNLLSLIGYCEEKGEEMLVYEFMAKGTLRDNISVRSQNPLGFTRRLEAALASARGILYLHREANPPVIHRDIKTTNILLDANFNAKVADFGLSRLAPVSEGTSSAHISTVVKGTPGYLDPEYFLTHKLTDKSDVYSLGVVFLELLTGMQPISHGKNIVREVSAACESGKVSGIFDSRMEACPMDYAERWLDLALRCCGENSDERPSMGHVVRELEIIRDSMRENYSMVGRSISIGSESYMYSTSSSTVSRSNLVSGSLQLIDAR